MKILILAAIKKLVILGRKWAFGLLSIAMRESVMKNCGLRGSKGVFIKKTIGSILVEFQDESVIWKIAKNPIV